MSEERYIAVIEISSSKIIGAVARTRGVGELDVIAVEQEKGVESVRYGVIKNLEETSLRVSRVIDRLQSRPSVAPRKISSVYVGLSGRSVRSITAEATLQLPDDTEITDQILDRLKGDALSSGIDVSLELIDAIPRYYIVGGQSTVSPKGAVGNSIKGVYDLIVCRPEIKRNITRVISDKLNIGIKGVVVTALACGHLILSTEEKRLGCILVDMGAETTTVTIYKDGHLRYFETIPLGGRNITRDLTTLSLLEERAEEIKLSSGNAIASDKHSTLNLNGVKFSDVSNLIVARAEEIVANVIEQIEYAGLKEKDLPAGIVLIGGASNLNGMLELMTDYSGLGVRKGKLPAYVKINDTKVSTHESLQTISVLYAAATNGTGDCLSMPEKRELPSNGDDDNYDEPEEKVSKKEPKRQDKTNKLFNKWRAKISNLFANPEEDESDIID